MKKIFDDLQSILYSVAQLQPDRRFGNKSWCKTITGIDLNKTNGYSIIGDFISKGTMELELKPTLFLVKAQSGSMKYNSGDYSVILMDQNGDFKDTDIGTNDNSPGWALRIRDDIKNLLEKINDSGNDLPISKKLTEKGEYFLKIWNKGEETINEKYVGWIDDILYHDAFQGNLWIYDDKVQTKEVEKEIEIPDELKD